MMEGRNFAASLDNYDDTNQDARRNMPQHPQDYDEYAYQRQVLQQEPGYNNYEEAAPPTMDPDRLSQPLKLFVGQVPKTLEETDLALLFEPYGRILDMTVIRDRRTGTHRGCAFVTYERGEDAMRVVREMHGRYRFEGAAWPAQVRPAQGEVEGEEEERDDGDGECGIRMLVRCCLLGCVWSVTCTLLMYFVDVASHTCYPLSSSVALSPIFTFNIKPFVHFSYEHVLCTLSPLQSLLSYL